MSSFKRFDVDVGGWDEPPTPVAAPASDITHSGEQQDVMRAIEAMEQGAKPYTLSDQAWFVLMSDVRGFTTRWLDIALGCGWSLRHLYGAPLDLEHRRMDQVGVVLMLRGREIVSIDADRILIGNPDGRANVFWRQPPGVGAPFDYSRASLIWEAVSRGRVERIAW